MVFWEMTSTVVIAVFRALKYEAKEFKTSVVATMASETSGETARTFLDVEELLLDVKYKSLDVEVLSSSLLISTSFLDVETLLAAFKSSRPF